MSARRAAGPRITGAIVAVLALAGAATAGDGKPYRNSNYGYAVVFPAGAKVCANQPPNPNHGALWLLGKGPCPTDADWRDGVLVDGSYDMGEDGEQIPAGCPSASAVTNRPSLTVCKPDAQGRRNAILVTRGVVYWVYAACPDLGPAACKAAFDRTVASFRLIPIT